MGAFGGGDVKHMKELKDIRMEPTFMTLVVHLRYADPLSIERAREYKDAADHVPKRLLDPMKPLTEPMPLDLT